MDTVNKEQAQRLATALGASQEQIAGVSQSFNQPVKPSETTAPLSPTGGAITAQGILSQDGTTPIVADVIGTQPVTVPRQPTTPQPLPPEQPKPAEQPKTEINAVRDRIAEIVGLQQEQGDFTIQQQEEQKLAEKRQTLTDLTNQYNTTRKSYEDQINALRDQSGMLKGGAESAAAQLQRRANQDLANIAIQQQVAQGNVDTALAIINDKVTAKFEPLKAELETQKTLFSLLQDDLSESEKIEVQARINREDKELDLKQSAYTTALKGLAESGAPQSAYTALESAMNNPNATAASIIASAGSYLSPKEEYTFRTLSDGRDVMMDKSGNIVKVVADSLTKEEKEKEIAQQTAKKSIPVLEDKLVKIDGLLSQASSVGMASAVGPNILYRVDPSNFITGARYDFIAGVEQLVSQETLNTLINLKAQGGTLGALSDAELMMLNNAASRIGKWAIKDKSGTVTGYRTTENAFKKELETIKSLTERAINTAYGFDMSNDEFINAVPTSGVDNSTFFNSFTP